MGGAPESLLGEAQFSYSSPGAKAYSPISSGIGGTGRSKHRKANPSVATEVEG
jgi:hypothetical protein